MSSESKRNTNLDCKVCGNGPIGEFQLTFLGEYTRFENFIAEDYGLGDYR